MSVPKRRVNQLVAEHGLRFLLREDYRLHGSDWTRPGFRAIASYRFAAWAHGRKNPLLRLACARLGRTMLRVVRSLYGIELYPTALIGRRFQIGHQNGIVIHRYATIGDDCLIRQGVTLGAGGVRRLGEKGYFRDSAPVVGNRVDFGAGSMIVGKVRIGDDVNVGPNAVVITDVPPHATVMAPMSKMMQRPKTPEAASADPVLSG